LTGDVSTTDDKDTPTRIGVDTDWAQNTIEKRPSCLVSTWETQVIVCWFVNSKPPKGSKARPAFLGRAFS
jgi:hypothetical protein